MRRRGLQSVGPPRAHPLTLGADVEPREVVAHPVLPELRGGAKIARQTEKKPQHPICAQRAGLSWRAGRRQRRRAGIERARNRPGTPAGAQLCARLVGRVGGAVSCLATRQGSGWSEWAHELLWNNAACTAFWQSYPEFGGGLVVFGHAPDGKAWCARVAGAHRGAGQGWRLAERGARAARAAARCAEEQPHGVLSGLDRSDGRCTSQAPPREARLLAPDDGECRDRHPRVEPEGAQFHLHTTSGAVGRRNMDTYVSQGPGGDGKRPRLPESPSSDSSRRKQGSAAPGGAGARRRGCRAAAATRSTTLPVSGLFYFRTHGVLSFAIWSRLGCFPNNFPHVETRLAPPDRRPHTRAGARAGRHPGFGERGWRARYAYPGAWARGALWCAQECL